MSKKILVIDDDVLVLKSLKNLLARASYEVKCVKSGEEAEVELENEKYDLIISDVRMPKHDGVAVIKKLKEVSRIRYGVEVPFIFITGYASEDVPIEAVKLGAKDYILKPFDLEEILKSVSVHATN